MSGGRCTSLYQQRRYLLICGEGTKQVVGYFTLSGFCTACQPAALPSRRHYIFINTIAIGMSEGEGKDKIAISLYRYIFINTIAIGGMNEGEGRDKIHIKLLSV